MDSESSIDEDLSELTSRLRGLRPAHREIDRDRLLYQAGRSSASNQRAASSPKAMRVWSSRAWPTVTAVSLSIALFSVLRQGDQIRTPGSQQHVVQQELDQHTKGASSPRNRRTVVRAAPVYLLQRTQTIAGKLDLAPTAGPSKPTVHNAINRERTLNELLDETVL